MPDTEHLRNLRNGKNAEVPLSDNAAAVRAVLPDPELARQEAVRLHALARLRVRAALGDEVLADLLTALGLASLCRAARSRTTTRAAAMRACPG